MIIGYESLRVKIETALDYRTGRYPQRDKVTRVFEIERVSPVRRGYDKKGLGENFDVRA